MPRIALPIDMDDLVKRYVAGESSKKLGDELVSRPDFPYGASAARAYLRRAIQVRGLHWRGASEAETLKWENMTAEQRSRQVAGAHLAARGSVRTEAQKRAHALSVEVRCPNVSAYEAILAGMLVSRGVDVTPQKAFGIYNVDLACLPVAVEVFGGTRHGGSRDPKFFDRFPYLLDQGLFLVMIWCNTRHYGRMSDAAADYVVSCLEHARRDPSLLGQYRMIWGDGEETSRGRLDFDNRAVVNPTRSR